MAYRYKKAYRKRSGRYRRRYSRYRPRYYRKSKRFRSHRKSKVEYKRIEGNVSKSFEMFVRAGYDNTVYPPPANSEFTYLAGIDSFCYCIGGQQTTPFIRAIPQGTHVGRRIGAKINPVKLRLFGTVSFNNPAYNQVLQPPQSIYIRLIVFQTRNGSDDFNVNQENFSMVNPIFDSNTGAMTSKSGNRLFTEFYGQEMYYLEGNDQQHTWTPYPAIKIGNLNSYQTLTKVPYRNGIGGSLKILKDKTYRLNVTDHSSFSFRFKTKKPNRMVWAEHENDADDLYTHCKNPIYITWWFIPTDAYAYMAENAHDSAGIGRVTVSYGFQMYYTDL